MAVTDDPHVASSGQQLSHRVGRRLPVREKIVSLRLSGDEHESMVEVASWRSHGCAGSLSTWLRSVALDAVADARGQVRPSAPADGAPAPADPELLAALDAASRETNRVGTNLNQVTRVLNAAARGGGEGAPTLEEVAATVEQVAAAVAGVRTALDEAATDGHQP